MAGIKSFIEYLGLVKRHAAEFLYSFLQDHFDIRASLLFLLPLRGVNTVLLEQCQRVRNSYESDMEINFFEVCACRCYL